MERQAPTGAQPADAARLAGHRAEAVVAEALARAGWRILGRRVRAGRSELDIVAVEPGPPPALVIVEVRWRRSRAFGLPEETVDARKVARLRPGALARLGARLRAGGERLPSLPLRIDLVAVEPATGGRVRLRHHRGIGEGSGGRPL